MFLSSRILCAILGSLLEKREKKSPIARTAVVKLDFLDKGKKYACAIYQDGKNADYEKNPKSYQIIHKTVKKGDVLKINEARGGGFAISLLAK